MSGSPTPDASLSRRVRAVEREAAQLKRELSRLRDGRQPHLTLPRLKLWRYTLNERMGATTSDQADADLLAMDGTDTGDDVDILDPAGLFQELQSGHAGYCLQVAGKYYALHQRPTAFVAIAPSGGLPARSGNTAGSASCTIYRVVGSTITTFSVGVTVKNLGRAVAEGDYFPIVQDQDDTWITGTPEGDGGKVKWAVAQSNWANPTDECPYVSVKACDNCDGDNPTGTAFNVLLPRTRSGDPNVETGDVLGYKETDDGKFVCVTDYMDAKIGTATDWLLTDDGAPGDIPSGWALMDGTSNSVGNGGSGIDTHVKFIRYTTSASPAIGDTGGDDDISGSAIAALLSVGAHDLSAESTAAASTSITIDNHAAGSTGNASPGSVDTGLASADVSINDPGHIHSIGSGFANAASGGDRHTSSVTNSITTGITIDQNAHKHTIPALTHSHTTPQLSHGVNDPQHDHALSGSLTHTVSGSGTEDNRPAFVTMAKIERIDNSL